MKTMNIVLMAVIGIAVVMLVFGIVKKRRSSKVEISVFIDDKGESKFKLNLTEAYIKDLAAINEIKNFDSLPKSHHDYFYFIIELIICEFMNNKDFSQSFLELVKSITKSFKEYVSQISQENSEIFKPFNKLNDAQISDLITSTIGIIDLAFSSMTLKIDSDNDGLLKNQWILLDEKKLEKFITLIKDVKYFKINLLPQDDSLLKSCTEYLIQSLRNKDRVIFESPKMTDELMKIQEEYLRKSVRFILINCTIYLFSTGFSKLNV